MHPINQKLKNISQDLQTQGIDNQKIKIYLKDYLQDILLYIIYNHSELKNLIFYGGTCLRKIYKLNRFSEDLDFEANFDLNLKKISKALLLYFSKNKLEGVSSSIQKGKNINRVTVKFQNLHEINLSTHKTEKIHVKVEINDKLTGNYPTELTSYMKDQYSMLIKHYDLTTLMAGKITACLTRVFRKGRMGIEIKGRDFYDLVWFMQQEIVPNEKKLKDVNTKYSAKNVFKMLDERISKISTRDLLVDLEPLFSEHVFIRDWCQNFHEIYNSARKNY
jgi:predicted nucleotidyltransferase component of viral defense system